MPLPEYAKHNFVYYFFVINAAEIEIYRTATRKV